MRKSGEKKGPSAQERLFNRDGALLGLMNINIGP